MPIHPLTVHFPIALLTLAAVLFTVELIWKKAPIKLFGLISLIAGVAGAGVAVLTGNFEMDSLSEATALQEVVELHELLGYLVLWLYGMLAVWAFMRRNNAGKIEWIALVVLLWLGLGMVFYTAHLGGTMVYEHGAGMILPTT